MGKSKLFKMFVMVMVIVVLSAGAVFADDIDYTVEVKFLLDSCKVLDGENQLNKDLQDMFAVEKTNNRVVLYVDNPERVFNNGGWTNRIREKEGKKNIEITYKKRYAVKDGDISASIEQAIKDDPIITDGRFEAEVDWSYDKMTLSFSSETKISKPEGGLKGMSQEDLVGNLLENMPKDEGGWMFAKLHSKNIPEARIAGPVDYVRYTGSYKEVEIDIEVWKVPEKGSGFSYVTELSFEGDSLEDAAPLREEVMNLLDEQGILVHESSLKTNMILDAYL